ncbi:TolC family protein [Thiomicrospira microaerophila]|uniref:TolC family protein n=1 Tax=Thiomicrospira microaerophila TaxID=406020 RepID=UPI000AEA8690|nr:TolC family protein [Thiomicrospira microaerophila]
MVFFLRRWIYRLSRRVFIGFRQSLALSLALSLPVSLGLFLGVSHGYAGSPTQSLGQTWDWVLSAHPSMSIKQRELAVKGYELDAANWGRWPTLGLNSKVFDDGYEMTLTLEQPLWSGGKIDGQIALSSAQRLLASVALQETGYQLMMETLDQYFSVLRLERRVMAAKAAEAELQLLLEMIGRRVAQQVNPVTDEVLAAARLRQAVTDRLQYERQLRETLIQLEQASNKPVGQLLVPGLGMFDGTRGLDVWRAMAVDFSPVLRRLDAELAASTAEVSLARAQVMPLVVLGYEQVISEQNRSARDNGRGYLAVQAQSGAGLSSRSVVSAARSRRDVALATIRQQDLELGLQVLNAWTELQSLEAQLPGLQSLLQGTEDIVASYLKQFQVGRKSWLDVLNAQKEKAQAFYMLTDVEMPLMAAKVRLMVLAGELNIGNVEKVDE